ncbi:MAG: hypothetical protein ACD_30C00112G0045 [uncultured bacterium]|uniref:Fimbrial assembly family protein n=4 Tax=Candidatus Daviesiibacteriota TaxID=1752718 RepID=A0A0G0FAG0_9BACT|nr:MAG: hypothetical protein ACD_30C00112G0045 [uncultured bacterium]KKQ10535.1 MAG: hypothetical protein US19_C0003G0030 [Candidatus Daviesbacteria bacterium GW2011_GWB1_36_5]KKQ15278.1 MAG: hypothetical protein US28_C0019G0011 [Candidatus Daviesbacteria bacterium GW2011_GWA1_36_8]OGE17204.1 MAG: hypothetical protein A2858_00675 [Candidatus Daviesbacteria bacterium RIFCSPHIGHO2_01_FULL_36_37]OGE35985.1 MAG: hypothetical protein A3E66_01670 [Candidatus Daviesbacteria bacterium RIFCSPHIGHO2_12_F
MNKLEINLLPPELNISKKESLRKKLVFRTSFGFLVLTILATIVLFALVITKNFQLNNKTSSIETLVNSINSHKEQESLASVLRARVNSINALLKKESPEVEAYNLITILMPPNVNLINLSLDKNRKMLLTGETSNFALLDSFFTNLTDPKIHLGRINGTSINSLSVTQGSRVKFDLTINLASSNGKI